MDVPRDHHIEQSQTEKDQYHMTLFLNVESYLKGTNELIYKTGTELQM